MLRDCLDINYVFVFERRAPMTTATFQKLIARAGHAIRLGMSIHPNMLPHPTGFKLVNDGQNTRAIQLWLG
jgi:type 1 fimbriae regulatory protein FimB/type 1 fimbriae regulatory protein FimE